MTRNHVENGRVHRRRRTAAAANTEFGGEIFRGKNNVIGGAAVGSGNSISAA